GNARTLTAYRNAIASFVDALDLPRFAIVGNSMGGTLAIMVALDRPARVAKVVVLDAAGLTPKLPGRTARMYLPFLLPSFVRAPGPKSVRKLLTKAVFHDPSFADDRVVNEGTGTGNDSVKRCEWALSDPALLAYHDTEWGVPEHDDRKLFEFLVLEGAQAGLSWLTVLKKRENFRKALDGFDPSRIARY